MKRRSLVWQLFPFLWVITFLTLVIITIFISQTFEKFFIRQTISDLQNRAFLIRNQLNPDIFQLNNEPGDSLSLALAQDTDNRITIISPDGKVIGDSETKSAGLENHAGRPEVSRAFKGKVGLAIRYSQSIHAEMIYVAVPVYEQGQLAGILRVSLPIGAIHEALKKVYVRVAQGGLAVMIIIVLAGIGVSKRISKSLENMSLIAGEFAEGNLHYRIPDHDSAEIGALADALNQMAVQLDERLKAILRQRNEQQAVLASMVEGVVAVDLNERIINMNKAAQAMLDIKGETAYGRYIHEVIRNAQIQHFVLKTLTLNESVEEEITISKANVAYFQAHGTMLKDASDRRIGAVIVLNDITRIRQLEKIRKDFVANVSHELRTPITSIKGFVETLRDGALNNPGDASRFLDIIVKQADRLDGIIEDLLSLSRIEEKEDRGEIELSDTVLKNVLQAAIHVCEPLSKPKNIAVNLKCDEELVAKINADLFQQAIVNLLNNAIKYSPEGQAIDLTVDMLDKAIKISVADRGPGIAREHLDRLFERFYRVDKERSRQFGGTGLGLAIVKHIALVHHGSVEVESAPGKGSIFIINLPA